MPRLKVTEIVKLPTGTARFPEVTPALKTAYAAKVAEGKVTPVPQSIIDHGDGYTTTTTASIWINEAEYQAFRNYHDTNFKFARDEYYNAIHQSLGDDNLLGAKLIQISTETLQD